jgi:hypothetical protein
MKQWVLFGSTRGQRKWSCDVKRTIQFWKKTEEEVEFVQTKFENKFGLKIIQN